MLYLSLNTQQTRRLYALYPLRRQVADLAGAKPHAAGIQRLQFFIDHPDEIDRFWSGSRRSSLGSL